MLPIISFAIAVLYACKTYKFAMNTYAKRRATRRVKTFFVVITSSLTIANIFYGMAELCHGDPRGEMIRVITGVLVNAIIVGSLYGLYKTIIDDNK